MNQEMDGKLAKPDRGDSAPDSGCRFHRQRLHLHLEGELDPSARRFIAAHLEVCAGCRGEFERLERERLRLLESMVEAPELPASFAAKVVETIRRREESRARRAVVLRRRFALGLAAGVLIGSAAVTLGLWTLDLFRQRSGEAPVVAGGIPPSPAPEGGGESNQVAMVPPSMDQRGGAAAAAEPVPPPPLASGAGSPARDAVDRTRKPGPRTATLAGFDLLEVWEKVTDSKPCTEDLNQDGAADIADAVFLFNNHYRSAVPMQASWSIQESLGLPDCSRWCEIHQHNL